MNGHSVQLIGVTKPLIDEVPDERALLSYVTRVSSTSNQENFDSGAKLIRSLIRRKEWSPLDMLNILMEVNTTRAIGRQILRHWSMKFQEFSQRYAIVQDGFLITEARMQHPTDRQASIDIDPTKSIADWDLCDWWERSQQRVIDVTQEVYNEAIDRGIAKECARNVLPEGMTRTKMYINAGIRSWYHWVLLRDDPKTQKEHRHLAHQAGIHMASLFPDVGHPGHTEQAS